VRQSKDLFLVDEFGARPLIHCLADLTLIHVPARADPELFEADNSPTPGLRDIFFLEPGAAGIYWHIKDTAEALTHCI
jgi:hypothetical protein